MKVQENIKRQSVCNVCGRRLSIKTPSGEIRWQMSHVDDRGLYCEAHRPEKSKKSVLEK